MKTKKEKRTDSLLASIAVLTLLWAMSADTIDGMGVLQENNQVSRNISSKRQRRVS